MTKAPVQSPSRALPAALPWIRPLAMFLHHLSHATYEAAPETKAAAAAPAATTESASSVEQRTPEMQPNDPTPYMDFMKFLTQATYHSPGTKPDPEDKRELQRGAQTSSGPVREDPSTAAATPRKPFLDAFDM